RSAPDACGSGNGSSASRTLPCARGVRTSFRSCPREPDRLRRGQSRCRHHGIPADQLRDLPLHLPARPPLVLASLREPLVLGVDSIEEAISGAVLEGPTCGSSRRASGAVDQLTGGLSS